MTPYSSLLLAAHIARLYIAPRMDWRVSEDELLLYLRGPNRGKVDRHKRLTQALNWLKDSNVHGEVIPGQHANVLISAGLLYFDSEQRMYDIIEPIKSWLGEPALTDPDQNKQVK